MFSAPPPEEREPVRAASFGDLDAATVYAIMKLRCDVFVVEQKCYYADLDGRDTEPGTRHVWLTRDAQIAAYLRILDLDTPGAARIGRVVTAPAARGSGLAGRLMTHALTVIGERPSRLSAQAHLTGFYARFGYTAEGPEYLEDGIPHVPMTRPAQLPDQGSAAISSAVERRRPV
ncbi:GNAT family N-acetyltransferase [Mangrovihabitans endophyticus]|uniref:ElaA protein n=1 Tax=Mangrovihabitans endophyticus TaxID=1751298 RepID=A0A8J3C226_9ACTN|nr:GNAT family N-acetyltransferase [Mangrovihabitans endophyticus]GGL06573.1 ElaA protein [Mangrovihabitans endophyticus]